MSSGPIEFLSDEAAQVVGHSQFGGADGLIQPEKNPLGSDGHPLESDEVNAVISRAAGADLTFAEQVTGVWDADGTRGIPDGTVVDPITGREVEDDMNADVTGVGLKRGDTRGVMSGDQLTAD